MELSQEELLDLAYRLLTCTDVEADLIYEELTEWQFQEVSRMIEQIVAKMEKWS